MDRLYKEDEPFEASDPERTRTSDKLLRRQLLFPLSYGVDRTSVYRSLAQVLHQEGNDPAPRVARVGIAIHVLPLLVQERGRA